MNLRIETQTVHRTVREGYQVLLRIDGTILLPTDSLRMRSYYQDLANACFSWAEEIEGERIRASFLSLGDSRERSRFRTERYRWEMQIPWENDSYLAVLCRSFLGKSERRSAQLWNKEEETLLPLRQVVAMFGNALRREEKRFSPHGIYPEGETLVLFRNGETRNGILLEQRIPMQIRSERKAEDQK